MIKAEVADFIKENIKGMLNEKEGQLLYDLAKNSPRDSIIVEIGSWMGKSTLWLLAGSQAGNKIRVYSIDHHIGDDEIHRHYGKIWTYNKFKENIQKSGFWHLILPLVMTSKEASQIIDESISLLFIDGCHEYESVLEDYNLWYPKIITEGIIAFHDYRPEIPEYKGLRKVVDENIKNNENWEVVKKVMSIVYARKNIK